VKRDHTARRLEVEGIVQGVGFRPFVYRLAREYGMGGEVANTSSGVTILLEGPEEDIESFERDLHEKAPPLSRITKVSAYPEKVTGRDVFSIRQSRDREEKTTLISPDVCVCDDCLDELFDARDRRYHYPFINCTNCGPRYTIIDDIPYDRPHTSMKSFRMCQECQAEYDDPGNRRFHAQPNGCAECGPRVTLFDNTRGEIRSEDPVRKAALLLRQGYVLAIKGIGGFHLAADAENDQAVRRLRERKHREEKPLALMSYAISDIRRYAVVEEADEPLLTSPERPIVLLEKKRRHPISEWVAPRNRYFGAMLPYTPLHFLLLHSGFTALVMTSGNMSEEPIAIDNEDAFFRLSNIADYFLIHNRDIYLRSDDSIVRRSAGAARVIRRSRGYVPMPVFLKQEIPRVLACGAELKNTICLTRENKAFLSQHIGDLENVEAYDFFCSTIEHMKRILHVEPEILAYDFHPDYLSTRYALEQQDIEKVQVQHHHAHIVSCMAENLLDGPVIGLSLDGTGYGSDGAVWGGEVLLADRHRFERKAHMSYVPMPGGASAIKQPWRMAISYLYDAFGDAFRDLDLPVLKQIENRKIDVMVEMISKRVNAPNTSSLGRLFDGIAALVGIRNHVHYEGQAAMELEMIAENGREKPYEYEWTRGEVREILTGPIIKGVVHDMETGVDPSRISGRFHLTLVRLFSELCEDIRAETGLNRVALSGGVFQNRLLLEGLIRALEKSDFEVFSHKLVPTNDGGISLGQAVVAAAATGN
jgi:hydrogenase maturation protein HypF